MDKASVTSPIDFLKNGFEAVYGGYGRRHLGKSWEILTPPTFWPIHIWVKDAARVTQLALLLRLSLYVYFRQRNML